MILDFFVSLLVIWETVYACSFGRALIGKGQFAAGIFVIAVSAAALILCINYIFGFISL